MSAKHPVVVKSVMLIKAGDGDLVADNSIFPLAEEREIAQRIANIAREYSYLESSEFEEMAHEKSESCRDALKRRYSAPALRTEKSNMFLDALTTVNYSDRVVELLPKSALQEIRTIQNLLSALGTDVTDGSMKEKSGKSA